MRPALLRLSLLLIVTTIPDLATAQFLTDIASIQDSSVCAVECLTHTLNQTIYLDDNTQPCHHKGFYRDLTLCLTGECTYREALDFLNTTQTACGLPRRDHRRRIEMTEYALVALALVFYAMRVVSKYLGLTSWGHDDTHISMATALAVALNVCGYFILEQGLGKDIWTLTDDQITAFYKFLLVQEGIYLGSLTMIRISILFFYLRVFPDPRFRTCVWFALGYVLLFNLIIACLALAQRQPLWLFWEGWKDMEHQGKTIDANAIAMAHAYLNMVADVWMLAMPMTQIYKLGLKMRKKLAILALFSVGLFLTIVSALRIRILRIFATSSNTTADCESVLAWSNIEICVGIVVACMPQTQQLTRDVLSRVRPTALSVAERNRKLFVQRSLATFRVSGQGSTDDIVPEQGNTSSLRDEGTLVSVDQVLTSQDRVEHGDLAQR